MTSKKQLIANQKNALLSTGPKTDQGKVSIVLNAIKHGIFTKELIISSALGKENGEEYLEMLNNLISCLSPQNQMESLLVEKIAIDFWRLKRVIRFETGSIAKCLEILFKEFYSFSRKPNLEIDSEIQYKNDCINWLHSYIECLKKDEVNFDQPKWIGKAIESNISDDFCSIINTLKNMTSQEKNQLLYGENNFTKMQSVLAENGYSTNKTISVKLIEIYSQEKQRLEKDITELEQKRLTNIEADKLTSMLGMIPQEGNTDKILKYERSLQKSIFQNLFLLKRLQELF